MHFSHLCVPKEKLFLLVYEIISKVKLFLTVVCPFKQHKLCMRGPWHNVELQNSLSWKGPMDWWTCTNTHQNYFKIQKIPLGMCCNFSASLYPQMMCCPTEQHVLVFSDRPRIHSQTSTDISVVCLSLY